MTERYAARRGGGLLVKRLAAVAAGCLLIRAAGEMLEEPGRAGVTDRLGAALMALELPGAMGEPPEPGRLALDWELPGRVRDTEPEAPMDAGVPTGDDPADAGDPIVDPEPALPVTGRPSGDVRPEAFGQEGPGGTGTLDAGGGDPGGQNVSDGPGEAGDPDTPDVPGGTFDPGEPEVPLEKAIPTTITGAGSNYTGGECGIYMKNKTAYDIDIRGLLERPLAFETEGAAVLIIHTHGSEAYCPTEADRYEPSDPSRTEDRSYNVVRVGDELARVLEARGIRVVHDRELYDYPSYTGSYTRSLESIKAHLKEDPDIRVVIDLHRDAILAGDGTPYKVVAKVGDTPCSQVSLICGSNYSGLNHPDWMENLSFAIKLQEAMVTKYPTLARPLKISEYRYNQHATTGSLIAEFGTNGNTLREALTAARYFGECLADVLSEN